MAIPKESLVSKKPGRAIDITLMTKVTSVMSEILGEVSVDEAVSEEPIRPLTKAELKKEVKQALVAIDEAVREYQTSQ